MSALTLLPGDDLAAAIAAAPPGAALLLAPGEYRFGGCLQTAQDLTIQGAGPEGTVLIGETPGSVLWHHAGPGTLTLRRMAMVQHVGALKALSQDGRADLVVVTGGRLVADGCAFPALEAGVEPLDPDVDTDWWLKRGGTAIVLRNEAEGHVRGCRFGRAPKAEVQDTQGVEVEMRARATIAGCDFTDLALAVEVALGAAIELADSRFTRCTTAVSCSYWEASYDGHGPRPEAPRAVAGCTFEANGVGLVIGGPQQALVRGCAFTRNERPLIVREVGARLEGNVFTGNALPVADPFGVAVVT